MAKVKNRALGIALKSLRERLGESQTEFGSRLGIDQSTLSRWEKAGPMTGPAVIAVEVLIAQIEREHPDA